MNVIQGNIFRSSCQTLVNTVNCEGVMGAGLALECRLRYPDMFTRYAQLCAQRQLEIGRLWLYKAADRWLLNFPTKDRWRNPSRPEYLHQGLQRFMDTYQAKGIESIAFPLLGAQNGGLSTDQSLDIMQEYLPHCTIAVEVYLYDPQATDDLFEQFKAAFMATSDQDIQQQTGLRTNAIDRVRQALERHDLRQLGQLGSVPGIGEKTLEKAFAFVRQHLATPQPTPTPVAQQQMVLDL